MIFTAACWAQLALAEPVRVAVLSSANDPAAASLLEGVRLATEELNWKGGLAGRPIRLIERDDADDPERADALVRALLEQDRVEVVVGLTSSPVALRIAPQLQAARVPLLLTAAGDNTLTQLFTPPLNKDNYVFRVAASDAIQAQLIAREVLERGKFRRVAILAEASAYGRTGSEAIKRQLQRRLQAPPFNGKPDQGTGWLKGDNLPPAPFRGEYQPGQTDMSALVEQARQAGAEVLLIWGQARELAAIAKARAKLGWEVPLIGGATLGTEAFIRAAGNAANGVRLATTFAPEPITPRRQELLIGLKSRPGALSAPMFAAQAYDAMLLLDAAARQAGSTEGAGLRQALESLKTPVFGAVTTYTQPFAPTLHEAIAEDVTATGELRGNRLSYAHPDEVRAIIMGRRTDKRNGS